MGDEKRLFITEEREKKITDLFAALTSGATNNWAGTYMVRTSVLFKTYTDRNIYPSRLGQNFQILLPVAYQNKFGYIDVPLMEYFIYKNSHSHTEDLEAQYLLMEKNANGWKDIYVHVLEKIEKDAVIRQVYLNEYEAVWSRAGLHRAIRFDKTEAIHQYYKKLIGTGRATLTDRIVYSRLFRSPLVIPLKFARRIKMMFSFLD